MKTPLLLFSTLLFLSSEVLSSDEESKLIKAPDPLPGPAKPPAYPPKVPVLPPPITKPTPPPVPPAMPTPPPIPPAMPPPSLPPAPPTPALPIIRTKADCIPGCDGRCKLHSRKRLCMRACMTCCDRCKCVPPGTYGNRELCGKCYTDMTTHGNRIKCP